MADLWRGLLASTRYSKVLRHLYITAVAKSFRLTSLGTCELAYPGAPEARHIYRFFRNSAPAPEERHINGIICRSLRSWRDLLAMFYKRTAPPELRTDNLIF